MKDYSREALEEEDRPEHSGKECVEFCLKLLYKDKKHRVSDEVVKGLSFEELIGALLLAKDRFKKDAEEDEEEEAEEDEEEEESP